MSINKVDTYIDIYLSNLRGIEQEVIFPNDKSIADEISKEQYVRFFQGIKDKEIETITLPFADDALYAALIEVYSNAPSPQCSQLNIAINEDKISTEEALNLIQKIANQQQVAVNLNFDKSSEETQPESISEDYITELTRGIKADESLAIDLLLPGKYANSQLQRELDEIIDDRLLEKSNSDITTLTDDSNVTHSSSTEPTSKRRRKLPTTNVELDTDYDEEQDEEQDEEIDEDQEQEHEQEERTSLNDSPNNEYLSIKSFLGAYIAYDLPRAGLFRLAKSDEEIEKLFLKWINKKQKNDITAKIRLSVNACKQLIQYSEQFSQGLDFHHLPAGFELKIVAKDIIKIDFSKEKSRYAATDPLAVKIHSKISTPQIPNKLFQQIIAELESESPVVKTWSQMQPGIYERDNFQNFKNYLPKLLELDTQTQEKLFKLCWVDSEEPGKKVFLSKMMMFLVDNIQYFPKHIDKLGDLGQPLFYTIISICSECRCGPPEENSINDLVSNYRKAEQTIDAKFIFKILDDTNQIQLRELQTNFPQIDLNALLPLVLPAGNQGLTKLYQLYEKEPELFTKYVNEIYSKNNRYQELISEDTERAMQGIAGLQGDKKILWDTLYDAHINAQKDSNLYDLFNAFQDFQAKMEKMELNITGPFTFRNVTSLPNSLANIITILEDTSSENRNSVWETLKTSDLSNTGIIQTKAMLIEGNNATNSSSQTRWEYMCEEMQLDTEHAGIYGYFDTPMNYMVLVKFADPNNLEQSLQSIYRYIATRGKNAQLSLDFYKGIYEKISAAIHIKPENKIRLFTIIAASTVGIINSTAANKDLDRTEQYIDEIISLVNQKSNEIVLGRYMNVILDEIRGLPEVPAINTLRHLVVFMFKNASITSVKKLKSLNAQLYSQTTRFGDSVFAGMKDFKESDYNDPNIFNDYLNTINYIAGIRITLCKNDENKLKHPYFNDITNSLVKLISTFSIKSTVDEYFLINLTNHILRSEELEAEAPFSSPEKLAFIKNVLQVLENASNHLCEDADLNLQDLLIVVMNIKDTPPTGDAYSYLKSTVTTSSRSLADYFPTGYFEKSDAEALNSEILEKINNFPAKNRDDIKNLLNEFTQPNDHLYYATIINCLDAIYSAVEPHQFDKLLKQINNTPDLFANKSALDSHPLLRLLDKLKTQSQIQCLSIFLTKHAKKHAENPSYVDRQLAEKAILLIDQLHVRISKATIFEPKQNDSVRENDSLRIETTLKLRQKEYVPMLIDTLLAGNIDDSHNKEALESIQLILDKEEEELNKDDFQMLEDLTDASNFPNIQALINANQAKPETSPPSPTASTSLLSSAFSSVARFIGIKRPDSPSMSSTVSDATTNETMSDTSNHAELLSNARNEINTALSKSLYVESVTYIVLKLNDLIQRNPSAHSQLVALYNSSVANFSQDNPRFLSELSNLFVSLDKAFQGLSDSESLALCVQFNTKSSRKPQDLLELLEYLEENHTNPVDQTNLLKIAIAVINDGRDYNLEKFKDLCELYQHPNNIAAINSLYQRPPLPNLTKVKDWFNEGKDIQAAYQEYCMQPAHREDSCGFDIELAKSQWQQFKGAENLFGNDAELDTYFENFHAKTLEMQAKKIDELLEIYKNPEQSPEMLLASAAELHYRCKGQDLTRGDGFKPGSSMELNTTQYLAALVALKSGNKVGLQMLTGQGKTRTTAIIDACKLAQGKTVDKYTSDIALARRDFLQAKSFYDLLGVKSGLITSTSGPSSYLVGGINFSDPYNLYSFRNNAWMNGDEDLVYASEMTDRYASIDEGDKIFDMANLRVNTSIAADKSIRNMPWVYPLMLKYFKEDELALKVYEDPELANKQFMRFAANSDISKLEYQRLKNIKSDFLETWQKAALIASQLPLDKIFDIEEDRVIFTSTGIQEVNRAILLRDGVQAPNSKFSKGVYQFLQARLEMIRRGELTTNDTNLYERLQSVSSTQFNIPEERTIVYSTSMIDMMLDYSSFTLISGTTGHSIERLESELLYSLDEEEMLHIDVPSHKELQRTDEYTVTDNNHKQLEKIFAEIDKARANNQPILLFTSDNLENAKLLRAIREKYGDEKLQEINSRTNLEDEEDANEVLRKASLPGFITVATERAGRGFDFYFDKDAAEHGLRTCVTFLPKSERDYKQMIGRSGRMGQVGSTNLILNKQKVPAYIYTEENANGEEQDRDLQEGLQDYFTIAAKKSQNERLINITFALFRRQIRHNVFGDVLKQVPREQHEKRENVKLTYGAFLAKANNIWDNYQPDIRDILSKFPIAEADITQINQLMTEYRQELQASWGICRAEIARELAEVRDNPAENLMDELPDIQLSEKIANRLTGDTESIQQKLFNSSLPQEPLEVAADSNTEDHDEAKSQSSSTWQTFKKGIFGLFAGAGVAALGYFLAPITLGLVILTVIAVTVAAATYFISDKLFPNKIDSGLDENTSEKPRLENTTAEQESSYGRVTTLTSKHKAIKEKVTNEEITEVSEPVDPEPTESIVVSMPKEEQEQNPPYTSGPQQSGK